VVNSFDLEKQHVVACFHHWYLMFSSSFIVNFIFVCSKDVRSIQIHYTKAADFEEAYFAAATNRQLHAQSATSNLLETLGMSTATVAAL
jgi:hypothetical protein